MWDMLISGGLALAGGLLANKNAKDSAKAAQAAAQAKIAAEQQKQQFIQQGLDKGTGALTGARDQALGFFTPYSTQGGQAGNMLSAALGLSGPEAQAAYFNNFQNDPGYQATLRAGIDAINQGGASAGALRSGGVLKSLFGYGQQQMGNQFNQRIVQLSGLNTLGAGIAGNQANVASGYGQNMADLYSKAFGGLGNSAAAQGSAQAEGIIGAQNAKTAGMQNMLQFGGYGVGQLKQGLNDMFSKPNAWSGFNMTGV